MKELKEYIDSTTDIRKNCDLVFLTRTGKAVTRLRLNQAFYTACEEAKIKKITPDSLRGIYKMLKEQGYHDYAIMHSKKDAIKRFPERKNEFEKNLKERQEIFKNLINQFPEIENKRV